MDPVLVKVAFMQGVFEDSCRIPTRSELNYVSGFYDKLASAAYPFEKTASESIDFNAYLDSAHSIMCKEAVNWFGGGNYNPLNWAASAGDGIDKTVKSTQNYLGDKIHQTGMFDGGGNVVTNALADYGNKGYQGILGDTLKTMAVVGTAGLGAGALGTSALAGRGGLAAARALGPRALSAARGFGGRALSGAKDLMSKGLNGMKNWWGGGKGGQGAGDAADKLTKWQQAKKWGGSAFNAANQATTALYLYDRFGPGGGAGALPAAAQQAGGMSMAGPAAQGQIRQQAAGPDLAGASSSGFGLGAKATAPANDARYSGFLNKFKFSGGGAGGKGSFFK